MDLPGRGVEEAFKHMIEVLLTEIKVSQKSNEQFKLWLTQFNKFLKKLKPCEKSPKDWLNGVKIPLPDKILYGSESKSCKPDTLPPFKWKSPSSVEVVGSWAFKTTVLKVSHIDLSIEMPRECLNNSDLLNHKYHIKRALYLAYIAAKLEAKKDEEPQQLRFICPDGNPLKPVLEIVISKDLNVRLYVVPPADLFKFSRLLPDKNNLRFNHFYPEDPCEEEESSFKSTPHYNNSIASDILLKSSTKYIQDLLEENPSIRESIMLLKVWLQQRNLNQGFGSFSGFIITMFVCRLIERQKITASMSTLEILRIILVNLSSPDTAWNLLNEDQTIEETESVVEKWHTFCPVVLLQDGSSSPEASNSVGILNYTCNLSEFTYNRVRAEAKEALHHINEARLHNFQLVFMRKIPFVNNFDHIIQIPYTEDVDNFLRKSQDLKWELLNHSGYIYPVAVSSLGKLITNTLKERVEMLDVELPNSNNSDNSSPLWKITECSPYEKERERGRILIRFGLIINRVAARKLVEKAPVENMDDEDSILLKEFKELWGEKCELRRFRDGSMVESVVFEPESRDRVCFEMLKYTFDKHLGLNLTSGEGVSSKLNYLDVQLVESFEPEFLCFEIDDSKEKKNANDKSSPAAKRRKIEKQKQKRKQKQKQKDKPTKVSINEITSEASSSFDKLAKLLRQLTGLPLAITSVQAISPVLRFSAPFPTPPQRFYSSKLLSYLDSSNSNSLYLKTPGKKDVDLMQKVPKLVEPLTVLLQLETSGKWPDDLKAIERLKCAMLIRIGQLMRDQFGLTTQAYAQHLDVLMDGFVFRLRLTYLREIILLKESKDSSVGVLRVKVKDNLESLEMERNSIHLPQLTSTLHSFHLTHEPFGRICRLAKRWISSHCMLASYSNCSNSGSKSGLEMDTRFTEEAIELLVASLFISYKPYTSPPNEVQTGFLRFLHLLTGTWFDWKSSPLIVNFNEGLTTQDIEMIERDFVKRRETLPALFIVTPMDKKSSIWTKNLHGIILKRVSLLAQAALDQLTSVLTLRQPRVKNEVVDQDSSIQLQTLFKKVFTPSMEHFDVIIWLKKEMNSKHYQNIQTCPVPTLKFKKYTRYFEEFIPIVDFDPVRLYIQELRETFGHLAVFLNDTYGGDFVAAVWKPDIFKAKEFTASNARGRRLESDGTLALNVEAILEDFEVLGAGIVSRIETKSENWAI